MEKSQITSKSTTAASTVAKSVSAITAHLIYQVSARISSFAIKAFVVRALKPSQFAFTEIRLVLFVTLVLLPTISGVRPVALRSNNDQHAAALLYLCIALTSLITIILTTMMWFQDPENRLSIMIVSSSLLLRPIVELPVVFARRRQRYEESSRARAFAIFLSSIIQTGAVSLVTNEKYAAPANASGHLLYTSLLGITMYFATGPERIPLMSVKNILSQIQWKDIMMTIVGIGEGLIKFVLENGEAIILDITCLDLMKSSYKLAGNLGSMLARFFNEAVEEQAFNVFHRLSPAFRQENEITTSQQGSDMRETCISTLITCLKAGLLVSSLVACIGSAYSYSILRLLYGSKWADNTPARILLNAYLIYLLFMAANGVTEAFVTASGSTKELRRRTKFSITLSICYMIGLWFAAKYYEAMGIIFVNCINMFVRTCYSLWFFTKLTSKRLNLFTKVIPHWGVFISLIIGRWIGIESEKYWIGEEKNFEGTIDMLIRIGCHGISGIIGVSLFIVSVWWFEKEFITTLKKLRKGNDLKTKDA